VCGRRFLRHEGGASAAEFALVAPIFIALMFGIFQVGWAMHCASSVRYAMEEASRLVVVDDSASASSVEAAIRSRLEDLVDAEISVELTEATSATGVELTRIHTTYVHRMAIPFVNEFEIPFVSETTVARPT